MLDADYQIIEVGFDVPLPGATDQPWHRDFPSPPETRGDRRLTSLAFNVTAVDVTPEMAPFEIAPGTHWDDGDDFDHGMFAPPEAAARYGQLGERRHPRRGDMSVRTGLTLHRGTANHSAHARAVLMIGVVTTELADSADTDVHRITVTRDYHARLSGAVRRRLRCTVVDELRPIVQQHDIEGLAWVDHRPVGGRQAGKVQEVEWDDAPQDGWPTVGRSSGSTSTTGAGRVTSSTCVIYPLPRPPRKFATTR